MINNQVVEVTGSIKGQSIAGRAIMYYGRPKDDPPKTWKKIGTIGHNLGNDYNPSWMCIYRARDGSLRYEIYRDGSIFPFYGKIVFVEEPIC